jgi:hypothetical protein
MIVRMVESLRNARAYVRLSAAAKRERKLDLHAGMAQSDPGIDAALTAVVGWLGRAQDRSSTADGGVARHFSLRDGWSSSYPETTGYIVPTMLDCAEEFGDSELARRARRMLDWLVDIQLPCGGFQGGQVDATPVVPVTFNTGQILLGLAAGARVFGEPYARAMRRAADWLVDTQDRDGCWRKYSSPFAAPGEKAYDTHVAWGLFEAARVDPNRGYADSAMRNVRWALTNQQHNGWVTQCDLSDGEPPLTHTLGYFLRGLLEAYRFSGEHDLLVRARRTGDGLRGAVSAHGALLGRFHSDWSAAVTSVCLTGSAQVAHCWLLLYQFTGEERYRHAGSAANRFVRRTVRVHGEADIRGGVKGSFPVSGDYNPYEYLNWAAKFFIDSHLLERAIIASSGSHAAVG